MISLDYDCGSDVLYVKREFHTIKTSVECGADDNPILDLNELGEIVGIQWIGPHKPPHPAWDSLPEDIRDIVADWFHSEEKSSPYCTLQIRKMRLF